MFLIGFILLAWQAANPTALLQKGLVELQHGDAQAAREDLQAASKLDNKNPYIWSALAGVYWRTHEPEQAAKAAEQAEANGGDNPIVSHALALYYAEAGQLERAANSEERYARSPHADKLAKSRAASWHLASGHPDKAIPLAKEAAREDSQNGFELAQLFLRREEFVGAADVLSSGLEAHPQDPRLTLAMGVARYGERRFDEAIGAFLQVIKLDPDIEQSYLFLGRMLDQAGAHLDEIASDAEAWATRDAQNPRAKLLLAKVLLARDPQEKRAEPLLRQSIALDGADWEAHYQLGVLLENSRQYAAAAEELKRATELDAKQATPHYHLARVYDRLGNQQAAAAERAIHTQLTGPAKSQ